MTDLVSNRIDWLRERAGGMGAEDWLAEVRTALEGRVEAEELYRAEQVKSNRARALLSTPAPAPFDEGPTLADLVELILWLAIPYGAGDPVFETVDPWTRQPLEANARLARTWHGIVRGRPAPESPGMDPGGSEVIQ